MIAMSMIRPRCSRFLAPALGVLTCAALTLGGAQGLNTGVAQAATVERVVAVVADKAILLSDLHQRARPFQMQIYANVPEGAAAVRDLLAAGLPRAEILPVIPLGTALGVHGGPGCIVVAAQELT